jgi:exodeoxyribonuclease-3
MSSIRLVSYNIRHGGIGREDALVSVIGACAPDILILQEAIHLPSVERLARALSMAQWASRPGVSVAYMSRVPIQDARWRRPRWSRHAFLEVTLPSGASIFGVHLSAVHSNWTERRRLIELRSLLAHVEGRGPGFHVLTGDFNTLAPGERLDLSRLPWRLRAITWLTGRRIRWHTIKRLAESGYADAFRVLQPDEPGYTFPTWDPHLRLDYAFVPVEFQERITRCEVFSHPQARAASDHLPILADVSI